MIRVKRLLWTALLLSLLCIILAPGTYAAEATPEPTRSFGGGSSEDNNGFGGGRMVEKLHIPYEVFDRVVTIMQMEFTIYGMTITFWQVFLFTIVAGNVAVAVGRVLNGR